MKLIAKGYTTLRGLDNGSLFLYGDTLGFKSEYGGNDGRIDAYIVGSGEFFIGGIIDHIERGKLRVMAMEVKLDLT